MLDCHLVDYVPNELKPAANFKDSIAELSQSIAPLFCFCLVWSVGASFDGKTRPEFSEYFWAMINPELHNTVGIKMRNLHIRDALIFVVQDTGDVGCLLFLAFVASTEGAWQNMAF